MTEKSIEKRLAKLKSVKRNISKDEINTRDLLEFLDVAYTDKRHLKSSLLSGEPDAQEPSADKISLIFLPHSHCDPGWTSTLDGYYKNSVQNILDKMLTFLTQHRDVTYVWAETVYFEMWWRGLDEVRRDGVMALLREKRLEIVNGGWVVPDEATTHYSAVIDQLVEGHQWLARNIGVTPRHSWSLDMFGYSSSLAYLKQRARFETDTIVRVHQYIKPILVRRQSLEFVWKQTWDAGSKHGMTYMSWPYFLYGRNDQAGFAFFNSFSNDDVDHDFMVELIGAARLKASFNRHNVVLFPFGEDFHYQHDQEWQVMISKCQKVIDFLNKHPNHNITARFGTINDYVTESEAYLKANSLHRPSLKGDFFPYNHEGESYWTGYFSTRAYDKRYSRELEQVLRVADILNVLTELRRGNDPYDAFRGNVLLLEEARRQLGLYQHHDAITGTSKAKVAVDYEKRLFTALEKARNALEATVEHLLDADVTVHHTVGQLTLLPTRSIVPTRSVMRQETASDDLWLAVVNPTTKWREDVVRVTVDKIHLCVYDTTTTEFLLSQTNPLWIKTGEMYGGLYELVFIANLPPLASKTFALKSPTADQTESQCNNFAAFLSSHNLVSLYIPTNSRFKVVPRRVDTITLENEHLRARVTSRSGLLRSVTLKKDRMSTVELNSEILTYKCRKSGVYLFEPTGPATNTLLLVNPPVTVVKGPIVAEVRHTQRQDIVTHVMRVYNSSGILGAAIEVVNIADLTHFDDVELIMRVTSPSVEQKDGVFYTDSNGLNTMQRRRFTNLPRQANYYPMTSYVFMEDAKHRVSLLSAQSLGAASMEERSIEVMLDRRLMYADGGGTGEGATDNKRTPSHFFLLVEQRSGSEGGPEVAVETELSLTALMLLRQLQQQLVLATIDRKHDTTQPEAAATKSRLVELPSDVWLVNIRAVHVTNDTCHFALHLHRPAFDASLPLVPSAQLKRLKSATIGDFFPLERVDAFHETSLSLTHRLRSLDIRKPIKLDPHEVYSYELVAHC